MLINYKSKLGDDNVENRSESVNTRKSFICRMQYGNGKYDIEHDEDQFANSNPNDVSTKYKVIHCAGYCMH